MLYNFLQSEEELRYFSDVVLPDLGEDECLVLMLCARRKYLTAAEKAELVLGDNAVLRREIVSAKAKLPLKVKELCTARDLYRDRNGRTIPEHGLAVYLTSNPRSHRKAAVQTITELVERLVQHRPFHLDSLVKTQIHRAISRKVYLDLDLDPAGGDDVEAVLGRIRAILGATPCHVIRTRSGAHVLVQTQHIDAAVKRTFYRQLKELGQSLEGLLEIRGDALVPVPGTFQGGAMPYVVRP
jgi:hypothetical protein